MVLSIVGDVEGIWKILPPILSFFITNITQEYR